MMSGVPLETCWAFNKLWNNKFCYKAAFCWYFYWVIYDAWIHEYQILQECFQYVLTLAFGLAQFSLVKGPAYNSHFFSFFLLDTVDGLATCTSWMVWGSNSGGGKWFSLLHTYPDQPWVHQSYCTLGTGAVPSGWSSQSVVLNTHPLLAPR